MSYSIRLQSIKCLEEINEASASEEPYVLVTTVSLRSPVPGTPEIPPLPNFEVFRYGVFEDFDEGEVRSGGGLPFWGPSSTPEDIEDPERVAIIVSLLENDNSTPEQYQTFLRGVVPFALASSLGEQNQASRAERLTNSVRDFLNGIDLPIPFTLDDDHIGTELLRLNPSDLVDGGIRDKTLVIRTAEGSYELVFRITALQPDWRFCHKCKALFFDGDLANKGACPSGGGHEAIGLNFALAHDGPPAPDQQSEWRFCQKCGSLFFNGDPANKGACSKGGGHEAAGFNFGLLHDTPVPPNHQSEWRFCGKCMELFFNGDPNKGACPRPAPSSHEAIGLIFFLPFNTPGPNRQSEWRFCGKCKSLFFDGDPANKGACQGGGSHVALGLNFFLPFGPPESGNQPGWRFCGKCMELFFNDDPANKGACPSGGGHEAIGENFSLPTSAGPNRQGDWRFCGKCMALFFDGDPNKGVCPRPAPSSHEALGANFVLPHL